MDLLTRKFPMLLGLVVLLAGIGVGIWYVNSKRASVSGETKPNNVQVVNVADNKYTVAWVTTVATSGKVVYGKAGGKLTSEAVDERDELGSQAGSYITHFVTVRDLQPSTTYIFRVVSGNNKAEYDNNGLPYTVTTGPTIATTPPAETIYGQVQLPSTLPADGAIVYLAVPGAAPSATLVKASGSYTIPVSILRTSDLSEYIQYDAQTTVLSITVEQGKQQATATVSVANSAPVPMITIGQTHDFQTPTQAEPQTDAVVAQIEPTTEPGPSETPTPVVPGVFNVEPLGDIAAMTGVTIGYPAVDKEEITSAKPELSGNGPKATVISLVLTSTKKTYKDTIAVAENETWAWTPASELADGTYNLSLAYIDSKGKEQRVKRSFVINTLLAETTPAFEAVVGETATTSASAKVSPRPSPSVRAAIPATDSGIPVTGVIEDTLLTGLFAAVMMLGGVLLLAL